MHTIDLAIEAGKQAQLAEEQERLAQVWEAPEEDEWWLYV
jgi:hypothetical protein